jgi:hypothetical protein
MKCPAQAGFARSARLRQLGKIPPISIPFAQKLERAMRRRMFGWISDGFSQKQKTGGGFAEFQVSRVRTKYDHS